MKTFTSQDRSVVDASQTAKKKISESGCGGGRANNKNGEIWRKFSIRAGKKENDIVSFVRSVWLSKFVHSARLRRKSTSCGKFSGVGRALSSLMGGLGTTWYARTEPFSSSFDSHKLNVRHPHKYTHRHRDRNVNFDEKVCLVSKFSPRPLLTFARSDILHKHIFLHFIFTARLLFPISGDARLESIRKSRIKTFPSTSSSSFIFCHRICAWRIKTFVSKSIRWAIPVLAVPSSGGPWERMKIKINNSQVVCLCIFFLLRHFVCTTIAKLRRTATLYASCGCHSWLRKILLAVSLDRHCEVTTRTFNFA